MTAGEAGAGPVVDEAVALGWLEERWYVNVGHLV